MVDDTEVGETDLDPFPGDCWSCDVREGRGRLGLCGPCEVGLLPSPHARGRHGKLTVMPDTDVDLGAVAADPEITHAPPGLPLAPVLTGRYLADGRPDADEAALPAIGAIATQDVWAEILDVSATPRYRMVAKAGIAFYSPIAD